MNKTSLRRNGMRPPVSSLFACLLLMLGLLLTLSATAQGRNLRLEPAPSWVDPSQPDLDVKPPEEGLRDGLHYLLVDHQVRVEGGEQVEYRHVALRAVNAHGVEQAGTIRLSFDPSFQSLSLHRVQIRRGHQVLPRLKPGLFQLLQRESGLEDQIFDGRLTASAFLDDVRVGDVVEYSFSRKGRNPALGSKLFGQFDLQWSMPVERVKARLLWPQERALHWRHHNGAAQAQQTEGAKLREYRWELTQVTGRKVESDSPAWYDPYPWVQWSEYENWQAVAQWALPLYRLPERTPAAVQRIADQIATEFGTPEQRLLAALRWVQGEVRYFGVEIGSGSYIPNPPERVLQRRFGDCKDKTLLSLSLLRALGVPAQAALVHTQTQRGLQNLLPSPGMFNHVLVRAELNGQAVWLDPTRRAQSGATLKEWAQADLGPALVVAANSQQLQPMAGASSRRQVRRLHTVLDASAGIEEPVQYTVHTEAEGQAAEELRATLTSSERSSLQKQYLNFYAANYPGIEVAGPLEVDDDAQANRIRVTERYRIPALWQRAETHKRMEFDVLVPDVMEHLRRPEVPVRHAPLALKHPVDITSVTEVRLHRPWDVKPDEIHVQDPAFELRRTESWQGQVLTLTDHFRSQADHVPAADVERYAASLEKARSQLAYNLYLYDPAPAAASSGPHWLPAVLGTLWLVALAWATPRLLRWNPPPHPESADRTAARGLGGWLALLGLGMLASLWRVGKSLADTWPALQADTWLTLTQPGGEAYHPLWLPALLALPLMLVTQLAALLLCGWLYLKRRTSFPKLFIGLLLFSLALAWLDHAVHLVIPALAQDVSAQDWGAQVRHLLVSVIWIAYLQRSKRVHATFVERPPARSELQTTSSPQAGG